MVTSSDGCFNQAKKTPLHILEIGYCLCRIAVSSESRSQFYIPTEKDWDPYALVIIWLHPLLQWCLDLPHWHRSSGLYCAARKQMLTAAHASVVLVPPSRAGWHKPGPIYYRRDFILPTLSWRRPWSLPTSWLQLIGIQQKGEEEKYHNRYTAKYCRAIFFRCPSGASAVRFYCPISEDKDIDIIYTSILMNC